MNNSKVGSKPQKIQKSKQSKNKAPKVKANVFGRLAPTGQRNMLAAYGNVITDGNCMMAVGSQGVPKRLGFVGTRFVGSQYLTGITTAAASNALLDGASGGDLISANLMALQPDSLNGRIAAIANLYRYYQWKHLRVDYESASSTATAGAFALGILAAPAGRADGSGVEPTSFGTVQDCVPSVVGPYYGNLSMDLSIPEEEPLMTCDSTTVGTDANLNVYYLSGWPNVTSSGATARGYLRITYVIDFYSPCPTQGISFVVRAFDRLTVEEKREMLERLGAESRTTSSRGWDVVSSASNRK